MVQSLFRNLTVLGSRAVGVTFTTDIAPDSSKEFLDIQANIECGFTLECVRDMRIHTIRYTVQIERHNSAELFYQLDDIVEFSLTN